MSNWSTTDRIDYVISPKNTLTLLAAIGRQASSNPVGQTTAGRNVGPIPYNYGQTYAPKTAVGIIEDTHVFTPNIVNQFKYGFARYDGPTFLANQVPAYAASAMGLTNLPSGQAQQAFPIVTFAGTNAPTNWGGTTANRTVAENYTLLDNVQWVRGKHAFTIGGQIAWILYQTTPASGGVTPLTLANAVTETSALNKSSNSSPSYAATANTGLAYASFLVGQIDKASLTQYLVQEFGARFRAMSPYIQDNWKVTPKLTLDIGLRYDFFPTFREVHNNMTFFNPNLANPITGGNGALQYAGTGPNTCNCTSPANNYMKNIGPRLGLAYQIDPKTVVRASYGVMYTHGNAVGGGAASSTGTGTLGFSSGLSTSATGQLLSSAPLTGANTDIPILRSGCRTRFWACLRHRLHDDQGLYRFSFERRLSRSLSGWPSAAVHQLELRIPAFMDRRHHLHHHLRWFAGPLPARGRQQCPRLLGQPARSEVPLAWFEPEPYRRQPHRGLRSKQPALPG